MLLVKPLILGAQIYIKKTNHEVLFAIFAYNFTFSNKNLAKWHTQKKKDTIWLQLKP